MKEGEVPDTFFAEIDPNRLDEEWIEHPSRYADFAMKSEEADDRVARTKAAMEVCEAELAEAIRTDPAKFKIIGKLTEGRIKDNILLQPRYRESQEAYFKAKRRAGILRACLSALEHRKSALTKLCDLWSMSYFNDPKSPSSLSDSAKEKIRMAEKRKIRTTKQRREGGA